MFVFQAGRARLHVLRIHSLALRACMDLVFSREAQLDSTIPWLLIVFLAVGFSAAAVLKEQRQGECANARCCQRSPNPPLGGPSFSCGRLEAALRFIAARLSQTEL